jgi:hypothetical protein
MCRAMTHPATSLVLAGFLVGALACCGEPSECAQTQAMASLSPYCSRCNGNGQCDPGESCQSCPQDCGTCEPVAKWRPVASPTDLDLRAVRGSAPDHVWAVGDEGTALRYSGGGWERVPTTLTEELWDVWTDGPDNVWVVGKGETVLHWTAGSWKKVEEPTGAKDSTGNPPLFTSVSAAADDLWITPARPLRAKDGTLVEGAFHKKGSDWYWNERSTCVACLTVRIIAVGPGNAWVIRDGGAPQYWAGDTWTEVSLPQTGVLPSFFGLWATASSVWLVGESPVDSTGVILANPGSAWRLHDGTVEKSHRCRGVWARDREAWVVCLGGAILHFDGAKWSVEQSTGKSLLAVWGSDPADIWAVGVGGTLLHRSL